MQCVVSTTTKICNVLYKKNYATAQIEKFSTILGCAHFFVSVQYSAAPMQYHLALYCILQTVLHCKLYLKLHIMHIACISHCVSCTYCKAHCILSKILQSTQLKCTDSESCIGRSCKERAKCQNGRLLATNRP